MRKVNPERVAFIEKVLLEKVWTVSTENRKEAIKTLTITEAWDVIKDMQLGKTFMHTVQGQYIVDGMEYGMKEYKI